MRGSAPLAALALAAALAGGAAPAAAQSDILLQARSGSPPGDRFRVDSAGGLVSLGSLGIGVIPSTGPGERLMWHPFKAAFRAGSATGGLGDYWNDASVGFYSWAGGGQTVASGNYSLAMGNLATASGLGAVALGLGSTAAGDGAVAMGNQAAASGAYAFAMGRETTASASGAVAMGGDAEASGNYSFALGYLVTATGLRAVAVGEELTADANNAIVMGRKASANGLAGTFTWADASTSAVFSSSAAHSFQIRASGGVRLLTNSAATVGVSLNAGGSSWNVVSDRNRKRDFRAVDGEGVLARIRSLPVTSWAYIDEAGGVRHIGPMAQDWHAAFGLGPDETTINMSDLDGVNLAAAQALERRTADLQAQLAERDARMRSLEERAARMQDLEERVAQLEALLAARQAPPERP